MDDISFHEDRPLTIAVHLLTQVGAYFLKIKSATESALVVYVRRQIRRKIVMTPNRAQLQFLKSMVFHQSCGDLLPLFIIFFPES